MKTKGLIFLFSLFSWTFTFAQSVFVDGSFGNSGSVIQENISQIKKLDVDGKGRIVYIAYAKENDDIRTVMLRYLSDGVPDLSFGEGGIVDLTSISSFGEIAIQPDNKILLVPHADFFVRYNENGTLDDSFGTEGVVKYDLQRGIFFTTIKILEDNKILLASSLSTNGSAVLAKFNPDGTIDSSFGENGKLLFNDPGFKFYGNFVLELSDRKLLIGGGDRTDSTKTALIKLNEDGTYCPDFGNGGKLVVDISEQTDMQISYSEQCQRIILLEDKSLLAIGITDYGRTFLLKITENGVVDTSYGKDGAVVLLDYDLRDIQVGKDNKILIIHPGVNVNADFLSRLTINGDFDENFNSAQPFQLMDFPNGNIYSMKLLPDGKLLLGSAYEDTLKIVRVIMDNASTHLTPIQEEVGNKLNVYPNPVEKEFYIESLDSPIQSVSIFDIAGNLVYRQLYNNSKVEVEPLISEGVYFISVLSEDGRNHKIKLVKKN